jgi:TolA-binding protein
MNRKFQYLIFFILLINIHLSGQTDFSQKMSDAMNYYHNSHYADARRLFNELLKHYTTEEEEFAVARFYEADAALKMGEIDAAVTGFEFIVNNINWSKFREESLYKLGLIYFDKESYSKSRDRLVKLLNEYPGGEHTGTAFYWIGESYAKENHLENAIDFLQKAVVDKQGNRYKDYSIYTLANVYERSGDYKNAVKYYDDLLTHYPDSPLATDAQTRIGVCYFKLKDYQSSILELNNPKLAGQTGDAYAESLYLLANSHYRVEEYEEAEKSYNEIIAKFPFSDIIRNAYYGLAWTYFQQKKYNDAYKVFDFLSTGDDSIAVKSFLWKGESKRYAGQYSEAMQIFSSFTQKYPTHPLAHEVEYQMGVINFEQNKPDQSTRYLITATSSGDPYIRARAYTLLGEIELSKKQYQNALKYFEPALGLTAENNEVNKRAMLGTAITNYQTGDFNKSLETLLKLEQSDVSFEPDKVNFYLAETFFALGRYKDALTRYNSVTNNDKDLSKLSVYGRAYSYFNNGDYQDAAYRFNEFVDKYPSDTRTMDAKLRLADSYYGSKNYSAASKIYKGIFSAGTNSIDDPYTLYQYAQALFKSGETASAINEFLELQKRYPYSQYGENSLYTVGWIKFQEGNFEEAINDYHNVMLVYRNTSLAPIIYYSIGDAYFNQSKYDSAIVNYQRVISQYPSSDYVFDAINGIQYCYVALGQPNKAINLIDQFTSQNPNLKFSDQIFFKKGEIYYSQNDYENAKKSYEQFVSRYSKSQFVPDAYYWIGKSAQNLKQNEEAIFNFNKVFDEYPGSESAAAAVIEIGNTQFNLGKYQDAINVYDRAIAQLKKSPRIPEIIFNKGVTLVKMNEIQKAYDTFGDVILNYDETIFADKSIFEMGMLDLTAGRYENAEANFQTLAEKRTDDLGAKAQYNYGLTLFDQGKFDEAISALNKIRTVFPAYDEWMTRAFLLMGDCYVKLDDKRQAEEMYRAVVAKHKNDPFGDEARKKIRQLE